MNKAKYIELIRTGIYAGKVVNDKLYQADPRRIELDITSAFNKIFFDAFKKSPSNLDRYSRPYKNISVQYESATDTYYCILPVPVIQFPTVGDGIRRINTMQGKDVEFVPIQQKESNLLLGSEWGDISDVAGYWLGGPVDSTDVSQKNGCVYFDDRFDPIITAVKMDLVIPFTEYAMTDDVPVPVGKDLDVVNIIRQMYGEKPVDRLNNQNELA
jgi:hypothetical protein